MKTSLRILIVDDNQDGADSLATILNFSGHETHTAYEGGQALTAATEFRPQVVILDIGLPRMNGYEVCRRLREQPGGNTLFIIAQTGWAQEETRKLAAEAGFDHHLVKPVEIAELMALLEKVPAAPRPE